ncbi:MAG: type II toxin-antitoxin system VapC family toxin [Magnetococcales bacterium]|nr:type II toxin-antitoxin system VapC family toxin [Magnetococcales bacterium]
MIMIDTHTWLWWFSNPEKLSQRALQAIMAAKEHDKIYVSAVSAWEIALLKKKGRVTLAMEVEEWIARADQVPFLEIIPLDAHLAIRSVDLADFPVNDPADRFIVATAIDKNMTLVTRDGRIREYGAVTTLW